MALTLADARKAIAEVKPDVSCKDTGGFPHLPGYGLAREACRLMNFPRIRMRKEWESKGKDFSAIETEIVGRCLQYPVMKVLMAGDVEAPFL